MGNQQPGITLISKTPNSDGIDTDSSDAESSGSYSSDAEDQVVIPKITPVADPDPNQPAICTICYDTVVNSFKLDCNHRFCYQCIKAEAIKTNLKSLPCECPLCKQAIPVSTLNNLFVHPEKVCVASDTSKTEQYIWIYSGKHGGWWFFDQKLNKIVEGLYAKSVAGTLTDKDNLVEICGFPVKFDFNNMFQINTQNNSSRQIKRLDTDKLDEHQKLYNIKGISGIKLRKPQVPVANAPSVAVAPATPASP